MPCVNFSLPCKTGEAGPPLETSGPWKPVCPTYRTISFQQYCPLGEEATQTTTLLAGAHAVPEVLGMCPPQGARVGYMIVGHPEQLTPSSGACVLEAIWWVALSPSDKPKTWPDQLPAFPLLRPEKPQEQGQDGAQPADPSPTRPFLPGILPCAPGSKLPTVAGPDPELLLLRPSSFMPCGAEALTKVSPPPHHVMGPFLWSGLWCFSWCPCATATAVLVVFGTCWCGLSQLCQVQQAGTGPSHPDSCGVEWAAGSETGRRGFAQHPPFLYRCHNSPPTLG